METPLPDDFREFLSLFRAHGVEYLLIGGYAVMYHGFHRATGDLDVWIKVDEENATRVVNAIREFGFDTPDLSPAMFLQHGPMVRMGYFPLRIEVLTEISGVTFDECYAHRIEDEWDGVEVSFINREYLKANKRASGRLKDLLDLEELG